MIPQPAPPAPDPEPTPQVVQQEVERWAETDAECRRLHTEYHENRARIQAIGFDPVTGRVIQDGQLDKLNRQIQLLTLHTDAEARKLAGIELPEINEFQAAELRARLAEARVARADLWTEVRSRRDYKDDLSKAYDQRLGQAKTRYLAPYEERKREADREVEIQQRSQDFAKSYQAEFDNAYNRYASANPWILDPGIKEDFYNNVKRAARSDLSALDNLGQFMEQAFKAELALSDRIHRTRSRGYAQQKIADSRPQAPAGAAAVAPPLPNSKTDWEAALRRDVRAIRANTRR